MARKPISKKARFEVFKRDSFTCQYCGKSAPDVVLNVDHIVPVASGGDNAVLNLLTSCFDCNSGKGKRALDDSAVVSKQIDQLKILNERKNQIEMIGKWRASLAELENSKLEILEDAVNVHLGRANRVVSESFLRTELKSCVSKYGLEETLDAVEKSANQYLVDHESPDHRNKFLTMIPRICYWTKHEKENPEIGRIRKIAYAAKRKWWRCEPHALTRRLLHLYQKDGIDPDTLHVLVMASTGIMSFENEVQRFFDEEVGDV